MIEAPKSFPHSCENLQGKPLVLLCKSPISGCYIAATADLNAVMRVSLDNIREKPTKKTYWCNLYRAGQMSTCFPTREAADRAAADGRYTVLRLEYWGASVKVFQEEA